MKEICCEEVFSVMQSINRVSFWGAKHARSASFPAMDQLVDSCRYARVVILKGGPDGAKSAILSRLRRGL
jgi:hypothetical protein